MQPNEKKNYLLVQTLWIHSGSVTGTLRRHKGLRQVSVQVQSTLRLAVFSERVNGTLVAGWRLYGAVTATSLRFYCVFIRSRAQSHVAYFVHVQNVRQRMEFSNVQSDPTATNAVALLRRCNSLVTCVHLSVLRCLRTQRERPEDAAQL